MEAAGKVSKGDGKDVSHLNNNTNDNSMKNLKAQPAKKNRSYPRTKSAGRKATKWLGVITVVKSALISIVADVVQMHLTRELDARKTPLQLTRTLV